MIVSLYIYSPKYQNTANLFTADNDIITVDSDIQTADQTILSSTEGFFDVAQRIELYDDEKISITSSIQNINDISKVFTDYSQTFTVPASQTNNEIFKHWYENSLDNGFDQRLRYDGYIEIDTQTFRVGRWQLESATIKDNRIENYKLTFYGNLKSLTDKFGEDKLENLVELNEYSITYSPTEVRNRLTATEVLNVGFPLISSKRLWGTESVAAENPNTATGAIVYDELFPAVSVERIFNAIENRYGVTFNGLFLEQRKFKRLFCWFKKNEAEKYVMKSAPEVVNFTTSDNDDNFTIDTTNNTVIANSFNDNGAFRISFTLSSSQNKTLFVYRDGELLTSIQRTGTGVSYIINSSSGPGVYSFKIANEYTPTATTYTFNYNATIYVVSTPRQPTDGTTTTFSGSGSGTFTNTIDLTDTAPDIKIADFFSGILKTFNLTCYSTDGINFNLEQVEDFYYLGSIKDFSEYVISDSLDFDRVKPYKKIDFKYQKSESILNKQFYDEYKREYGDLVYSFNNDGADYTIQLPFENIIHNNWGGNEIDSWTNPLVAYAVKPEFTPYKPKPVLLYQTGNIAFSVDWYFTLASGSLGTSFNAIMHYSQDDDDTSGRFDNVLDVNTLNWGAEISTSYNQIIYNSLYNNYYLNYLLNLYSLKSRLLKVKMRLPYLELLNLKLNDRIVIRDKRYVINQYTTDLTTFESDFELIQDFRNIDYGNGGLRQVTSTAETIDHYYVSPTNLTWTIDSDPDNMIFVLDNFDGYVQIKTADNLSGSKKIAVLTNENNDLLIIEQDA